MKRAKQREFRPKILRTRYSAQELIAQMAERFEPPEDLREWESMKPLGKELGSAKTPWISPPDKATQAMDDNPKQDK